jgi:hypothetical protein
LSGRDWPQCGLSFFGVDHIVFASDSPFGRIDEAIEVIRQSSQREETTQDLTVSGLLAQPRLQGADLCCRLAIPHGKTTSERTGNFAGNVSG